MKKPNLLVLGASGGVATAFLHYLVHHRDIFGRLVLLSPKDKIKSNPYLEHKLLKYIFIKKKINPYKNIEYDNILKKYKINIVLDLTDADSIPILEMTNKEGVSYINTSLNAEDKPVSDLVFDIFPRKKQINRAPHILCAGMNPGIVNMWVRHGVEKFGIPKEIIHFEYDTSRVLAHSKLRYTTLTWSPHEFLVENVRDPSGVVVGKQRIKKFTPNALTHRENMKRILSPIWKMDKYPKGFVVLHEENLTIPFMYNIPSRFVYSINDDVMDNLVKIYKKKKSISRNELTLVTNTNIPLEGSDNIGVILDYKDKRVYYFNSVPNISMIGTNATYFQVITGIFAALFTLVFDKVENGVHFVEDLYNTNYQNYVFDNMKVQEFIFIKKNGLKLKKYNPVVRFNNNKRFEHIYI
ncbi:saccharopine dehydrogenase NADP-binding domain-containing protein [Candidatus Woesearchaeota archaeon]|nr:saccharopine dehydrogenase NADP-binding domain-containing protein [Candidatus Woesearchaeota archaeon]